MDRELFISVMRVQHLAVTFSTITTINITFTPTTIYTITQSIIIILS